MDGFANLILQICGITVFFVICRLIVSDGKMSSFTDSALGIVFVCVIFFAMINAFNNKTDDVFSILKENDNEITEDISFLNSIIEKEEEHLNNKINDILKENGYSDVEVDIRLINNGNGVTSEKMIVKITLNNEKHSESKAKTEEISKIVAETLRIRKEMIIYDIK